MRQVVRCCGLPLLYKIVVNVFVYDNIWLINYIRCLRLVSVFFLLTWRITNIIFIDLIHLEIIYILMILVKECSTTILVCLVVRFCLVLLHFLHDRLYILIGQI